MKAAVFLAVATAVCIVCTDALQVQDQNQQLLENPQGKNRKACVACKHACPHRRRKHKKPLETLKAKEEAELAQAKEEGRKEGKTEARKELPETPHATPHASPNKIPRSGEAEVKEVPLPEKPKEMDVTEALTTAEEAVTPRPPQAPVEPEEIPPAKEMEIPEAVVPQKKLTVDDDEGCSSFLKKARRALRGLVENF